MHIEISGELEHLIQQAIASGRFASTEECLEAMAQSWQESRQEPELDVLPETTDLDALILEQGIEPFDPRDALPPNLWPADEKTEDFLIFLRESRAETPRTNPHCSPGRP